MKWKIPFHFKRKLIRHIADGLHGISIDSPDNIRNKQKNANNFSSTNNPKWSTHNDWKSPPPEAWISQGLLTVAQESFQNKSPLD